MNIYIWYKSENKQKCNTLESQYLRFEILILKIGDIWYIYDLNIEKGILLIIFLKFFNYALNYALLTGLLLFNRKAVIQAGPMPMKQIVNGLFFQGIPNFKDNVNIVLGENTILFIFFNFI